MSGQTCPMAKMEKLLVATDGSTYSENAVKEAILLAKKCSSKLMAMGSVAAKVIGHAPCNVLVVSPTAHIEFKNILIATDGSRYSETAVREAIGIAKKCGSPLVAVSVASSEVEVIPAEENIRRTVELGSKEGVKIEGAVAFGKPYEAITETAKQKGVDIIVVGSHGRKGLERLLMGSVTERVIGHTEVAVLVVKVN